MEKGLKEHVKEQGNKITFVGPKSHEELSTIIASADLFVAPSIVAEDGDQEGLPLSIMEAMASGLPVISGISGGTKDIVKDEVNGFILDVKDIDTLAERINRILNDDSLAMKMREEDLNTAKGYDYESIGKKYYELIQKALMKV